MRIIFTVTNDLTYDQRMHRICGTLAANGHVATLVGRSLPHSIPLEAKSFAQKRLRCVFHKGFAFYAEFNLRLFFFLLGARYDAVCSIDLDTIAAGCLATLIRRKKRVYDAHEYFTEVPELAGRPLVKSFWDMVARVCLPFYRHAYTVGPALSRLLGAKYGLPFGVVRNMPFSRKTSRAEAGPPSQPRSILYQGALNEGRGIETMLEAMQHLENVQLLLAGGGDFSSILRKKSLDLNLGERVIFLGYVKPAELKKLTDQAWLGLNLLENRGLSYYYSLANKFFDCVQSGVPVLTMDFPEYRALNAQHEVAVLLEHLKPELVAKAVQMLQHNPELYQKLQHNCSEAREIWNWEMEQHRLLAIWQKV